MSVGVRPILRAAASGSARTLVSSGAVRGPRGRRAFEPARRGMAVLAAVTLAAPAWALTPIQRLEASDLVSRCLAAVEEGRAADTLGLRRADGAVADAVRAARGGTVWSSPFGEVLMHQATPRDCTVIAPGADPRAFAFWVERWSNGPEGRMWAGKWFGQLETTAWRRFRRRGGGPVRLQAVTGAGREASEMRVMRGWGGR